MAYELVRAPSHCQGRFAPEVYKSFKDDESLTN